MFFLHIMSVGNKKLYSYNMHRYIYIGIGNKRCLQENRSQINNLKGCFNVKTNRTAYLILKITTNSHNLVSFATLVLQSMESLPLLGCPDCSTDLEVKSVKTEEQNGKCYKARS